jgi:hypothetical protein
MHVQIRASCLVRVPWARRVVETCIHDRRVRVNVNVNWILREREWQSTYQVRERIRIQSFLIVLCILDQWVFLAGEC